MRTLIVLKPDAIRRGLVGEILRRFERRGLRVADIKVLRLTRREAEELYEAHKEKDFFEALIDHITSGPLIATLLEAEGIEAEECVGLVRRMIGSTDPKRAEAGSIRGDLAVDVTANLIHAPDSVEALEREKDLFFGKR